MSRMLYDCFMHCSVGIVSLLIFSCFAFIFKESLLQSLLKNGVEDFEETQTTTCLPSRRNATEESVTKY